MIDGQGDLNLAQSYGDAITSLYPVALPLLPFESYEEGVCSQILHVGPFSEEGPAIEELHAFVELQDYRAGDTSRNLFNRYPQGRPAKFEDRD